MRLRWLALSALLLTSVVACAREPARATTPVQPTPITIAVTSEPLSALAFVADDQGFFARHGIDVRLDAGDVDDTTRRLGTSAQLALVSDTTLALARFDHSDLRVLTSVATNDDHSIIVVRRDRIGTGAQLEGKRIGVVPRSSEQFFLSAFLGQAGLTENDVDVVSLSASADDVAVQLRDGTLDAAVVSAPRARRLTASLGVEAALLTAPGLHEQTVNLVTDVEYLRTHPRTIESVLRALLDAETFAMREPKLTQRIVEAALKDDVGGPVGSEGGARLELALRQSLLVSLEDQADWAVRSGLARPPVPDYLSTLAVGPLERVAPERVTVIR